MVRGNGRSFWSARKLASRVWLSAMACRSGPGQRCYPCTMIAAYIHSPLDLCHAVAKLRKASEAPQKSNSALRAEAIGQMTTWCLVRLS
ncbi:hypothetical protein IG631_03591 [Alternaria alternata]|nr:hypothetical protein IG631_03591 [Alternaria alternata]